MLIAHSAFFQTLPQAYERESFNGLNLISAVRCNLKQELVIDVPESCFQSLDEAMVIKVGIAVKVVKAKKVFFIVYCFFTFRNKTQHKKFGKNCKF